ncbi:MAG: hypothetical protein O3C27_13525, partial [Actinomycetota bacterium]|nr:hypothetical protein [Actinomycetota bacterium]
MASFAPNMPEPEWDATFVAVDPPRASYFALWNGAESPRLDFALPAGWKYTRIDLITAEGRRTVTVALLTMRDAIDRFADLPINAPVTESVRAWAAVVRSALTLVAQGRVLPWVSPAGWDTWRVDPLDGQQYDYVEAMAHALPRVAYAVPAADSPMRHLPTNPEFAIRACWDAVADRFLRAPASSRITASPVFADLQPTRVRQLRPWVNDLAGRLCRSAQLAMLVLPPIEGAATSTWRVEFGVRPTRDPSLRVAASDLWRVDDEVLTKFGDRLDLDFLSALRQAAEICPVLAPALEIDRPRGLELDD